MNTNVFKGMAVLFGASFLTIAMGFAVADGKNDDAKDDNGKTRTRFVDCAKGETIADALGHAKAGRPLLVIIEGTCQEDVVITADDVTLRGGSGTVDGSILVDSAQRVVIDGMTVTGPGPGVRARANAAITVQNSTLENNEFSGIDITQGAFGFLSNNTVQFNGECEVLLRDSGHTRMVGNTLVSNQGNPSICSALGIFRDARARMRGGGNSITNNNPAGNAIEVAHGSTLRQDRGHDTVVGRVSIFNLSNGDFRDVDITGSISLGLHSTLRLRDQGTVPGNVTFTGGSININFPNIAQFSGSAVIAGTINCNGGSLFGFANVIDTPPNFINCP